jgi:hypothetical protein
MDREREREEVKKINGTFGIRYNEVNERAKEMKIVERERD